MSTSTPIPVYIPSEPTGPPPRDLRNMNNIPLVAQQYNLMRGERNRAIGERNRALGEHNATRNWLVYANNRTIELSSTSSQPSTKYDMATVGIATPIFYGRKDEDLNLFINNFLGYINTVGIDLLDDASVPPGWVKAMGVLRSCMRDEAARWFDAELTGKNWKLLSIQLVTAANGGAGATRRAFRALAIPERESEECGGCEGCEGCFKNIGRGIPPEKSFDFTPRSFTSGTSSTRTGFRPIICISR
ncbi:hypothetical protein RhiirA5_433716 [Rhizophagus irregularis]|uniref:Uncharacterized protein n=1 Tax=Rhizophagus irregularis TaxID=588596 RepID=A0A2N0NRB5_9GLOM|nr:hypothetical protein RhiirA5_433716 [Rhizophagus irregularis]